MQSKWILQSKTIIGAVLMVLPSILTLMGVEPPATDEIAGIKDTIFAAIDGFGEAVGFALVIWGRLTAAKSVTLLPKASGPTLQAAPLAVLLALLMLAGCVTASQGETSLLVSCRADDASLRALAGYRAAGELTDEQIATVDRWRPVLNGACSGDAASPWTARSRSRRAR